MHAPVHACIQKFLYVHSRYLYIEAAGWRWHGRNSTCLQIPGILECETTHLSIFGGVVDVALNLGWESIESLGFDQQTLDWTIDHADFLVIRFCPDTPKSGQFKRERNDKPTVLGLFVLFVLIEMWLMWTHDQCSPRGFTHWVNHF